MPFLPLFSTPPPQLWVSLYGETPVYGQYNVHPAQPFPSTPPREAKPKTPLSKLQQLGVPKAHAKSILNSLEEGDTPYHAGKLLNGKVYLITQQNNIYYGKPDQLVQIANVQSHRTKCFNQQVRKYRTPDGLSFTVTSAHGQPQSASVTKQLLGIKIPLPHRSQTDLKISNPRLPSDAFVPRLPSDLSLPRTLSTSACANDNPH